MKYLYLCLIPLLLISLVSISQSSHTKAALVVGAWKGRVKPRALFISCIRWVQLYKFVAATLTLPGHRKAMLLKVNAGDSTAELVFLAEGL